MDNGEEASRVRDIALWETCRSRLLTTTRKPRFTTLLLQILVTHMTDTEVATAVLLVIERLVREVKAEFTSKSWAMPPAASCAFTRAVMSGCVSGRWRRWSGRVTSTSPNDFFCPN